MVSTYTRSHTEMFAQKLVDMLPKSSMSRAILRTFGFECNSDSKSAGSSLLSCQTGKASYNLGIVKRSCSPSGFLRSPVSEIERPRSCDYPQIRSDRILRGVSSSQENTPPPSKRPHIRSKTTVAINLPNQNAISSKRPQVVTFESHVLRPRMSLKYYGDINDNADKYPNLSTSPNNLSHSVHIQNSDYPFPRFIVSARPHYYQPHFDTPRQSSSNVSVQKQIEIPSWRTNDVIADRYALETCSTRVLRTRDVKKRHPLRLSVKRQHPSRSDEDYEDLSDEAYTARHARFELEEIKQERLSILRLAEDELRQRLEQRERDSWRRRRSSRSTGYPDGNLDRFMPSQLICPVDKVQTIRVRDDVPIIAFGVKVPRPKSSTLQ